MLRTILLASLAWLAGTCAVCAQETAPAKLTDHRDTDPSLKTIREMSEVAGPKIANVAAQPRQPPVRMTVADLRFQEEAERAYEAGDYAHAYRIYLDRLAPRGDKHAQYMMGYMHEMGQVVLDRRLPADLVTACAWYRLAAERDDPSLLRTYSQAWSGLDDKQRAQADQAYQRLAAKYADDQIRRGVTQAAQAAELARAPVAAPASARSLSQAAYFGVTKVETTVGFNNWIAKVELGETFSVEAGAVQITDTPAAQEQEQ